ncbi:choline-glycine betaine transporter [Methylobacterium sp. BE186]|uniref:DUF2798 domain-containing protein n=1 Tax=Methylobacterium sp. BE186 TaxID=2817715 RepID=UPI00285950F4|nr:DUF2798 domain-containing protein [Methylobacterium sp. BE186]MDR7040457.1 choline-glycine betaine transporter [Methylobacterium sp. BE186]
MPPIARQHAHYVFAVLQSGITTLISSGIASAPLAGEDRFLTHWLWAWAIAWSFMIPIVVVAAPTIRRVATALTADPASGHSDSDPP